MKVLYIGSPFIFSVIPRIYPTAGDSLSVVLRNEQSDVELDLGNTFTITDKLNITLTSALIADFAEQNKYELVIKNGSVDIYRGRLIVLKAGTDIQNYENSTQTDERFKYKS